MVAFNFAPEFVPLILSGEKRQTIRQTARAKKGDKLQLYTGLRTKNCTKLMDTVCRAASYCAVRKTGLTLGDTRLFPRDMDQFARADGFPNYEAMVAWFSTQYGDGEFVGVVHAWTPAISIEEAA